MLDRHSSQNVKRAVPPRTTRSSEAVRTAFSDTQLLQDTWRTLLHSGPTIAEVDWTHTVPRVTSSDSASAEHTHGIRAPSNNRNVVQTSGAVAHDAGGFRWLALLKETVLSFHAHWQREREITKAVAALSEFDDRTLRDMGISSRSEIEHAVRYCRDC
jgi:uncharacterized protein YjiS (DUF1127 family)